MAKEDPLAEYERAYKVLVAEKNSLSTAERSQLSALDFIRRIQQGGKKEIAATLNKLSHSMQRPGEELLSDKTIDDFLRHLKRFFRVQKKRKK